MANVDVADSIKSGHSAGGVTGGVGAHRILFVSFMPTSLIYFKQLNDTGIERVSVIDRRHGDNDYDVLTETPLGLHVERKGFLHKLILWHHIADMDYAPVSVTTVAYAPSAATKK